MTASPWWGRKLERNALDHGKPQEHFCYHQLTGEIERKDADSVGAWTPWILLALMMIVWPYFKIFTRFQISVVMPWLHNAVYISLYRKPYAAIYNFQPLAAGTAALRCGPHGRG